MNKKPDFKMMINGIRVHFGVYEITYGYQTNKVFIKNKKTGEGGYFNREKIDSILSKYRKNKMNIVNEAISSFLKNNF